MNLDRRDVLRSFHQRFVITDPELIYFDGNSLGRLPVGVLEHVADVVEHQWGDRLIRSWNDGWWESATRVGARIAPLVGATAGEVIVADQTSVNLFKLAVAALRMQPGRERVVTDSLNFPSDLYVLQGVLDLLPDRHQLICIGSRDGDITPDLGALHSAIDQQTALVALSHVAFKSGYLYDMQEVTEHAHRQGALVLWDLSHSVGVVPIDLDRCEADFAIGCTYKYLNGGPGAPAFLFVRTDLQESAFSPIWGWWGEKRPFDFGLEYMPAAGVQRFLAGTAPILSMTALEHALAPVLEAGIDRIREKSTAMTEYAISLFDERLAGLGFSLGSPREPLRRGSHISLRHEEGYRINRALIDDLKVVPDFRAPDNLRLGFSPLYVSFSEIWDGMDRIARAVQDRLFEKHPKARLQVT